MGFFTEETELEKNYKVLIKVIKNASHVSSMDKEFLLNYVTNVKEGKCNNDFYEFDFLNGIILEILNNKIDEIEISFNKVREVVKILLPMGKETPDYNVIKELVINSNEEIDIRLYPLFENRIDYIQIIKLIKKESSEYYDKIVNYALDVSPYCINQTILVSEILSFVNGLKYELDDIDNYYANRLEEAKKRCGVYQLDEKKLSLIASEARKAQSLIKKLENLEGRVITYQEKIKNLTNQGKKEVDDLCTEKIQGINDYSVNKIKEMQGVIEEVQKDIIEKLDEYLLTLENNLKVSSDEVFNKILNDTRNQIREIKLTAQSLSTTTTRELLRVQKVSEESVEMLKKYVETEPQLQQFLKEAANSEAVKEALIKLNESNNRVQITSPGILIPGHDRAIVPANPNVILPTEMPPRIILPAFDENIPFDIRYQRIIEEKQRREANGEIFHQMVDEVINCVMEGDWVYLWGPSGCGKSHIIKQVASLVGIDLVENGKITDKYSIMAYNDPHGKFRATQAFVALVYGKFLSLDEFDNGNTDTQVVLNELYSGLLDTLENPEKQRFVTFAEDMIVPIHPNFRMISAGNTSGEGENQIFSSRGKIDESVQERMTPKRFDYDNKVEQRIFGEYQGWYNFFVNFRKSCEEYAKKNGLSTAPGITTTRDAAAIRKYINHNSKSIDQLLREKFIQTKDEAYLKTIANTMKKIYGLEKVENVNIEKNISLREFDEQTLAKKLIYSCQKER